MEKNYLEWKKNYPKKLPRMEKITLNGILSYGIPFKICFFITLNSNGKVSISISVDSVFLYISFIIIAAEYKWG